MGGAGRAPELWLPRNAASHPVAIFIGPKRAADHRADGVNGCPKWRAIGAAIYPAIGRSDQPTVPTADGPAITRADRGPDVDANTGTKHSSAVSHADGRPNAGSLHAPERKPFELDAHAVTHDLAHGWPNRGANLATVAFP